MMTAVAIDLSHKPSAAPETGFSGYVHGVSLVDLLQIFHYSRRSLTLSVEPNASIHVADGEIVHARVGEIEGELAISCLLERTSGRIRTGSPEVVPTTIHRPFNFLLLDALRGMDESHRDAGTSAWPEESGEFPKDTFAQRGSVLPSVPVTGSQLLTTACLQLAERVENTVAIGLVDLKERRLVSQYGASNRHMLESLCLKAFEHPELSALDQVLNTSGRLLSHDGPDWLDEVRYVGEGGVLFGKVLSTRALGLVLCARCFDSPGLAWAELRQSVRMMERIVP